MTMLPHLLFYASFNHERPIYVIEASLSRPELYKVVTPRSTIHFGFPVAIGGVWRRWKKIWLSKGKQVGEGREAWSPR